MVTGSVECETNLTEFATLSPKSRTLSLVTIKCMVWHKGSMEIIFYQFVMFEVKYCFDG